MTRRVPLLLCCAAMMLAACNGGSDAEAQAPATGASGTSDAQRAQALARQAGLPELDTSNSLLGPDADNNGVRDDIDKWISAQPVTEPQKKALLQYARATQAALTASDSKEAALAADSKGSVALNCLFDRFPSTAEADRVRKRLESYILNTEARSRAYMKFDAWLSGGVFDLPEGDTCEK